MNRTIFQWVSFLIVLGILTLNCSGPVRPLEEIQRENILTIVFPQTSTVLAGGQSFRLTVMLKDNRAESLKDASVEAQLWTPDGELFATLLCLDNNDGRYLSDPVTLPLQNSQGIWRVTVRAILGDDVIAMGEGQFSGQNSYSERLQELFGFWIELSDLFPYNVANAEDPLLKTYSYANGGYVILANNITSAAINRAFVILDVHWQHLDFPKDEISAVTHVLDLAGPHRITLDLSTTDVVAEKDNFREWPAWYVTGQGNPDNVLGNSGAAYPLDWVIFRCPGSEWLWTILITTNAMEYQDDLKSIRESFECSPH